MTGGLYNPRPVDDTPVNGQLAHGVTSNWAYDHAADLDAHTLNWYEQCLVGQYLTTPLQLIANTNLVMVQYSLYALLIYVPRAMTFDRIATHIEVVDVGQDIRLGVYNSTDLAPTTLVLDAGTVNTDTLVTKELTLAADLSLTKDYYFLVAITDSAATAAIPKTNMHGGSPLGISSGTLEGCYAGYVVAGDAGDFAALPDPFLAAPTLTLATGFVGLRVKSLD